MTNQVTPEPLEFSKKEWHDYVYGFGLEPWHGDDLLIWLQRLGWTPPMPTGQTEILFANGNLAVIPDEVHMGIATLVKTREEEWRDIVCIVGLKNSEIERGGTIRHKKTGWVPDVDYDTDNDQYFVSLTLNGKPLYLIGQALADVMWGI